MFEYEYRPNDIDTELFLSEIPMSLLKENIKSQFENPLEFKDKDNISTFISKYRYTKDNIDIFEDDERDTLQELRDRFYSFMEEIFMDYLGIGINDFEDLSPDDQDDMIHYTYRFFIMNIKKNFVHLILNTLEKNRSMYDVEDDKKKDVTSLSFKRFVTDNADVYILSNLSEIIDEILADDISVDTFFELCDDPGDPCLETRYVQAKFDEFKITGNFTEMYKEMLDSDFISDIESKVRNKILKKYKKIKKEDIAPAVEE